MNVLAAFPCRPFSQSCHRHAHFKQQIPSQIRHKSRSIHSYKSNLTTQHQYTTNAPPSDENTQPAHAPLIAFSIGTIALGSAVSLLPWALLVPLSLASDTGVAYNPEGGSDTFKTIAGVGYIILVIVYFVRLFKKRADRATSIKLSSSSEEEDNVEEDSEDEDEALQNDDDAVTPVQCLMGFAQASVICYLLYILSTTIDGFFDKQTLPQQYTARNIAVLVQTVVRGLSYLATFIFGANAVGLAALGVALVVAPEWVESSEQQKKSTAERLPKVSVTDDIMSIRRAFREAEQMGKKTAKKEGEE